jgi:hypothetical protein
MRPPGIGQLDQAIAFDPPREAARITILPQPVQPLQTLGFSRPIRAIEGAHWSPVFISSNVSNRGTRSMISFAAPFNPVPRV